MKTQILDYEDCGKPLRGFLVWDEAFSGVRPGVLVFHENMGLTEHEKERATRLASLGYIALACDMFGERATGPATDAERRAAFEEFRAKKRLQRVLAGLTALSAQPQVDTQRMAAIGFCLGGMAALELARFGADLRGVVSFHGGLSGLQPASPGRVKARILVCHGASDPFVTLEHVAAFTKEMQAAEVDYQINLYGGVQRHAGGKRYTSAGRQVKVSGEGDGRVNEAIVV